MLIAIVLSELPSLDHLGNLELQPLRWEVRRGYGFEVRRHRRVLVVAERDRRYSSVAGKRVVDMHCKQVVVELLPIWARNRQKCQRKRREHRGLHCRQV